MTTQTEALKLALEALETYKGFIDDAHIIEGQWHWIDGLDNVQTAIKEALAQPEQKQNLKLMPREATPEMLKAMDECSTEGYDERLYAGHAASVYMAAVDVAPTPPKPEQEPVAVYGYCPECGAKGVMRERRLNGNDKCASGHTYPSREAAALPQPKEQKQKPVKWIPIEQPYPQTKSIDILMGDGSILCAVLPQFNGDLWWEGSGTGEKFIDPKYANVTHWRIHGETTTPPQRKPWVSLSEEDREQHRDSWRSNIHDQEIKAIEAKLRELNEASQRTAAEGEDTRRAWEGLSVFEINDLVTNTEHGLHELVERTEKLLEEKNT